MFLSRKLIYESLCISINYAGNILHFNSKDLLDRFGLVEYTYDYKGRLTRLKKGAYEEVNNELKQNGVLSVVSEFLNWIRRLFGRAKALRY